jgi:2-keto-3-deoxy-L-rhamnonate aldolase RhmA
MPGTPSFTAKAIVIGERVQNFRCFQPDGSGSSGSFAQSSSRSQPARHRVSVRRPDIAMIAAACGFDAVYIDLEHNPTSLETAAGVCVAALGMGITPIAR